MLGIVSEDENQNKIFKPMAGATLGQGVPLGTWCSFEKDVAPSNNWLMAGTTFDASVYPALNLYLGTNKVPSRYDHNRPSDYEEMTYTANTDITLQYDGEILISQLRAANTNYLIYLDGIAITTLRSTADAFQHITIPFKKGQVLKITDSGLSIFVCYYTHPLFIKATSIASDTDQQAILAQIQAYNTYSTEETLTGKTWIDGKPIYRKCTKIITNSVMAPNITFSGSDRYHYTAGYTNNAETITSVVGVEERVNGNTQTIISGSSNLYVVLVSTTELAFSDFVNAKELTIILEYTKTTD